MLVGSPPVILPIVRVVTLASIVLDVVERTPESIPEYQSVL